MKNFTKLSLAFLMGATAISASAVEPAEINNLYVMGAVETGWNMGGTSLNKVESGLFKGQIILKKGDFKFNWERDNWGAWVWSTVENKEVVLGEAMGLTLTEPDGDYKWISNTPGAYELTVDLNAGTLTIIDSPEIYIIGDATPSGWNCGEAVALTRTSGQSYRGIVNLGTGEFKFLAGRNFDCSITSTESDKTMALGEAMSANYADNGDNKWRCTEAGSYIINITLGANPSLTVEKNIEAFTPTAFTVSGTAVTTTPAPVADGIFKYCGAMQAGSFKITATNDDNATRYVKMDGSNITYVANEADATSFNVDQAGNYQLTINSVSGTVDNNLFTPYQHLYIVGSFTGWSFVEMTPGDDDTFTWSGNIDPETQGNEVKFSAVDNFDQPEYMLHPYTNAQPLNDADYCYSGGNDNKWQVTQNLNYTITVNTLMQTVKVVTTPVSGSGIDTIDTPSAAPVYYNLQGVKIANPRGGIFIEVQGNKACKVIR